MMSEFERMHFGGGEQIIKGAPGRDGSGFSEEVEEEFFNQGTTGSGIPIADDEKRVVLQRGSSDGEEGVEVREVGEAFEGDGFVEGFGGEGMLEPVDLVEMNVRMRRCGGDLG